VYLDPVPAILRNFLYLDEGLTSEYLAQLEGGVYAEEDQSEKGTRNRAVEGGARAGPFNAKGSKGSNTEETSGRKMRQTPEGNYRRLEQVLEAEDAMQWLDAFDEAIWTGLKRGELVQVESIVKVPSLYQWTEMAASSEPLMQMMDAFGEPVDRETQEGVAALSQMAQVMKDVSVVAIASGTPRYKFICPLRRDFIRRDLASLAGECIVVGSIQRRLKPTERYSILDDMGMGGLPRAERRKVERDMKKELPDAVVTAPAAITTPLAIYR
jgi:hypothetical protein